MGRQQHDNYGQKDAVMIAPRLQKVLLPSAMLLVVGTFGEDVVAESPEPPDIRFGRRRWDRSWPS